MPVPTTATTEETAFFQQPRPVVTHIPRSQTRRLRPWGGVGGLSQQEAQTGRPRPQSARRLSGLNTQRGHRT